MTAVGANSWDIAFDIFLIYGLSLAVWLCYHVVCLMLPTKKIVLSILINLLFFMAAGFVCFCFLVGETASRQPRWHMVFGFALGAWIYYACFARYVKSIRDLLVRLFKFLLSPLVKLLNYLRCVVFVKGIAYLQKIRTVLYNKSMKARKRRVLQRRKKSGEKEAGQKKERVKPYTQS